MQQESGPATGKTVLDGFDIEATVCAPQLLHEYLKTKRLTCWSVRCYLIRNVINHIWYNRMNDRFYTPLQRLWSGRIPGIDRI